MVAAAVAMAVAGVATAAAVEAVVVATVADVATAAAANGAAAKPARLRAISVNFHGWSPILRTCPFYGEQRDDALTPIAARIFSFAG